ncbi:MAG: NAD(P)-binding domain-containing protein [Deltaproteobacteria bacterium]|nr:NAD(P)-binding domain-containing protein [Deltaproteobacteria bacterium]
MHTTLVTIVGAGPIGIELAAALKSRNISYRHFERGQIGSTIEWYAPGTQFFSSPERIEIAGVPLQTLNQTKATREEYLLYLRSVVKQFDLKIDTYHSVLSVERGDNHTLTIQPSLGGEKFRMASQYVVLAIGDMHRPRLLGLDGESLPHVSHYLLDPHHYFNKKVLIVGGKNSAVEAAIRLHRIGAAVSLSYRRAAFGKSIKYWLLPEIQYLIKHGAIDFYPETEPISISPQAVKLLRVAGDEFEVKTDLVLLLTGYEQEKELFHKCGIPLIGEGGKPKFNKQTMESEIPGIFVAGTASAGTQIGGVREFIETSHIHVSRIVSRICGEAPPQEEEVDTSSLES